MNHKSLSLSILLLLTLSSCKLVKWRKFTYYQEYQGNANIRMDGYYYHTDTNKYGPPINAFVLYNNGLYVNLSSHVSHKSIQNYINTAKFDSTLTYWGSRWGAFIIKNDTLKLQIFWPINIELLVEQYWLYEFEYYLKNDSTIIQTKGFLPGREREFGEVNKLYHFKEYERKPDSTNNWIVNSDKINR